MMMMMTRLGHRSAIALPAHGGSPSTPESLAYAKTLRSCVNPGSEPDFKDHIRWLWSMPKHNWMASNTPNKCACSSTVILQEQLSKKTSKGRGAIPRVGFDIDSEPVAFLRLRPPHPHATANCRGEVRMQA